VRVGVLAIEKQLKDFAFRYPPNEGITKKDRYLHRDNGRAKRKEN
jgi:hypothetical protein